MMRNFTSILILFITLISCIEQSTPDYKIINTEKITSNSDTLRNMLTDTEIINHVMKAINPKFKDWVLFSNGTYIILEDTLIKDKKEKAIEIMKEYGPVYPGSPAGDMNITKLTHTKGWVVGGHYYGMYTYIHPKQLEERGIKKPGDLEVGLLGRKFRDNDGKELKIIYIHQ